MDEYITHRLTGKPETRGSEVRRDYYHNRATGVSTVKSVDTRGVVLRQASVTQHGPHNQGFVKALDDALDRR